MNTRNIFAATLVSCGDKRIFQHLSTPLWKTSFIPFYGFNISKWFELVTADHAAQQRTNHVSREGHRFFHQNMSLGRTRMGSLVCHTCRKRWNVECQSPRKKSDCWQKRQLTGSSPQHAGPPSEPEGTTSWPQGSPKALVEFLQWNSSISETLHRISCFSLEHWCASLTTHRFALNHCR